MAASTPESGQNMAPKEVEVTSPPLGKPQDGAGTSTLQPLEIDVSFPLVRQSSIYSLTLDEIQNTVCEPGKNFGSMNMDEFLTNIWNVEEGFDASGSVAQAQNTAAGSALLNRQGSLSLPSQLCRKTVDEVWADIHREQQQGRHGQKKQQQNLQRPNHSNGAATRQPTFGEMTLEDFLIKAGVVRESYNPAAPSPQSAEAPLPPPPPPQPPPQYGLAGYTMGADAAPGFGHVYSGGAVRNGRRGELYCYAGDAGGQGSIVNGYGGLQLGMEGSPESPISSDGMGMGGIVGKSCGGGRKRMAEGAVEIVVERRQRRMIKNRESAARSRARKQAYTVELEAELNHLKEENERLRGEEKRVRQLRKQMLLEAMAKQTRPNMDRSNRSLRRCNSSPS